MLIDLVTLRPRRAGMIVTVVLGASTLAGCVHKPAAVPVAAAPAYSVDTPLRILSADPGAKTVLQRDVAGVMDSPQYPLFDDMSLAQIAKISGGRISKDKLDQVQADLSKVKPLAVAEPPAAKPVVQAGAVAAPAPTTPPKAK